MKAEEARDLTQKNKKINKELNYVLLVIKDSAEKGKYTCSFCDLRSDTKHSLENLNYLVSDQFGKNETWTEVGWYK